jgi:tetratricopeptide (TPR) repeat protein
MAITWFDKAITLAKSIENHAELASALHDRALTLSGLNRLEEAEIDAVEAAELRDQLNDRGQLAQTYQLLSSICRGSGRFLEAEEYSDRAAVTAALAQDPTAEGRALMDLVAANLLTGPDAREHLTKAVECFLRGEAHSELVMAYLRLAQIDQVARSFNTAEEWIRHAREEAEKTEAVALLQQVEAAEMLLKHNRAVGAAGTAD